MNSPQTESSALPGALTPPYRIRYRAPLVFSLGGFLGSGLNIAQRCSIYFALHFGADELRAVVAFFFGALAEQLFHHLYYHVVYVNQEIRMRTPLPLQFAMYLCVAAFMAVVATLDVHSSGTLGFSAIGRGDDRPLVGGQHRAQPPLHLQFRATGRGGISGDG